MTAKRRLTIDDLFEIRMVADPQISPDGRRVAFVVSTLDRDSNRYRSAIWMVDADDGSEPYRYTTGGGLDSSPRWSPTSGDKIAFLSDRSGRNQVHLMAADGGESEQLTSGDDPASDINWSVDGSTIYYVKKTGEKFNSETDTKVLRTLRNRMDGEGFWDGRRKHIFAVAIDKGSEPRQITTGDWDSTQPAPSPDGQRIAFCSNRSDDRDATTRVDVWIQNLETGETEQVTPGDGTYGSPSWSPDGERLAYIGHPSVDPWGPTTLDNLFVREIGSGEDRALMGGMDREPGASGMSDIRYNVPAQRPVWTNDGSLLTLLGDEGSVHIYRCGADGSPSAVIDGQQDIQSFSTSNDGTLAYASSSLTEPTDVFIMTPDGTSRLTNMNAGYLDSVELAAVEEIRYESDPGVEVHGWLLKPPAFNSSARYPAIIEVHGGPHGMYSTGFFHEMQLLAARGYVVLMTNPRGSTGYGQEWVAGTKEDWGGADYRDVIAGADYLAGLDFVDASRLGIAGGSYGGYMVNWALGQTDRFRAAVSQRSTANRASLYGTSDINWSYNDWEYGGTPYENHEFYRERSPLTYVENIKTPILLLHSENDLRCPISQSEEFFTALQLHGCPSEFVRFPDESHGLSRTGQPKHRVERLERICGWFDRYL
ncbi:MAG: S9 family peptidase [Thermomicrobiales bacterium]